jgi:hypothetical protein
MFGEDEEAAQAFALKARKAGFQALVGLSKGDSSDGTEEWDVNLV